MMHHNNYFYMQIGIILLNFHFLSCFVSGFLINHYHCNNNLQGWKLCLTSESSSSSSSTSPTTTTTTTSSEANKLKQELLDIGYKTNRGFQASTTDQKRAREICIALLRRYNPTKEPAMPYYKKNESKTSLNNNNNNAIQQQSTSLAGKWKLVYTDAPDITGLDNDNNNNNPIFPSPSKLGRIGQECDPPFIKNIIEWKRPDWAASLPFSGTSKSRVLQKVVTKGRSSPDKPLIVLLDTVGIEIETPSTNSDGEVVTNSNKPTASDLPTLIQEKGIPAALFSLNPVDLKGPLTAPFGQFEILYLDDEMRVVKTGQNYLAVNVRIPPGEAWF